MTALDDRLRSHYADRTAREPLPGPPTDEALDALQRGEARLVALPDPSDPRHRRGRWAQHHRGLLAAAAAVLVALVVAGTIVVTREERTRTSTQPGPVTTDVPPTPTAPPTTRATSSPDDTSGGAAVAPPPPAGLVVAAEGVLGRWDGTQWLTWTEGEQPPTGDEYAIVRLDDPISTRTGEPAEDTCGPVSVPTIDLGLSFGESYTPAPIGVAGVAEPRPRPVVVLDPSAVYQQAAADVAAGLGIDGPAPTVSQVVRGDLDGDGTDEVLVTAERPVSAGSPPGVETDVALVFLRRAVGARAENVVVDGFYPGLEEAPGTEAFRVAALADLNGDGRMEIVVDAFQFEGAGTMVFELAADGTTSTVLSGYCGV